MTVKTVFFDMGGTIETFWHSPEMRLAATPDLQSRLSLSGINLSLPDQRLHKLITEGLACYHQWRMLTLEEIPSSLIWQNYILPDYPEVHQQLEHVADDLMVWIETHYYQRQMRPEIPSVLKAIQQMGYRIGLISNVASRGQVPLNLSQYGIKSYFNPIVLSSEYGRRKPDPSIFHYAARLSNTPTSECIYIGDRIARDVVGARRAGFKLAILIRHDFNHGESDDGAVPDLIISNMIELQELLKRESRDLLQEPEPTRVSCKIRAVLFDADGVLYYRKNKDQELAPFIKQHKVPCPDDVEPEIAKLRHQAFIGHISFEQYKAGVLNLYGITDPALVAEGVATAIREKEQVFFWNDTLEYFESAQGTWFISWDHHRYGSPITFQAQQIGAWWNG